MIYLRGYHQEILMGIPRLLPLLSTPAPQRLHNLMYRDIARRAMTLFLRGPAIELRQRLVLRPSLIGWGGMHEISDSGIFGPPLFFYI